VKIIVSTITAPCQSTHLFGLLAEFLSSMFDDMQFSFHCWINWKRLTLHQQKLPLDVFYRKWRYSRGIRSEAKFKVAATHIHRTSAPGKKNIW